MASDEAQNYGFSKRWLDKHKDVNAVVQKAIDSGWTQERLAVEIKNTGWYRNQEEAQRKWSTIIVEQPREARRIKADNKRAAQQTASLLGVSLSDSKANELADKGSRYGWDEDDFRVAMSGLITTSAITSHTMPLGDTANLIAQINQYEEQYLIKVTNSHRLSMAKRLARGDIQMEDVRSHFVRHAARTYASVADDINAGMTMTEIMQPYLQDAAEELGVSSANINTFDPKWTAAVTGGDNNEALTREQWLEKIRTDKQYGYANTRKAKNEAAELSNSIKRMFGMG